MTDSRQRSISVETITPRILMVRGQRVLIDTDLAMLYGTSTKALNQAVKRNARRFPPDFMFRLTLEERSEVVTNCDHLRQLKFSPSLPHVFTEHGTLMAASVLNTARAIEASVYVVRTFVRLREMLAAHKELAQRLAVLERKMTSHDGAIRSLVTAIRQLMTPPAPKAKRIGFRA
jgi:hypothetical protein